MLDEQENRTLRILERAYETTNYVHYESGKKEWEVDGRLAVPFLDGELAELNKNRLYTWREHIRFVPLGRLLSLTGLHAPPGGLELPTVEGAMRALVYPMLRRRLFRQWNNSPELPSDHRALATIGAAVVALWYDPMMEPWMTHKMFRQSIALRTLDSELCRLKRLQGAA